MRCQGAVLAAVCLAALWFAATPSGYARDDDAPPANPDFAAVERAAQRAEPGTEYILSVPARRSECVALALQYKSTDSTAGSGIAALVEFRCISAILLQLEQVYYDSEAFPPDGMNGLIDRLSGAIYELYDGIYNEQPACRPWCGTMYDPVPQFMVNRVLDDAVEAIAEARLASSPAWAKWLNDWRAATEP